MEGVVVKTSVILKVFKIPKKKQMTNHETIHRLVPFGAILYLLNIEVDEEDSGYIKIHVCYSLPKECSNTIDPEGEEKEEVSTVFEIVGDYLRAPRRFCKSLHMELFKFYMQRVPDVCVYELNNKTQEKKI